MILNWMIRNLEAKIEAAEIRETVCLVGIVRNWALRGELAASLERWQKI